jgi:hypothetical protein
MSAYKHVTRTPFGTFCVRANLARTQIYGGTFASEEEAGRAADGLVRALLAAQLNFPTTEEVEAFTRVTARKRRRKSAPL